MKFPIGQKIKEVLQKSGITQVYFADNIGMSRRNLDRFFDKDDISIKQLVKASEILNYDFVSEYLEDTSYRTNPDSQFYNKLISEPTSSYKTKKEITVQLNLKGDISLVSKYFPEILDVVRREAESRGLTIA